MHSLSYANADTILLCFNVADRNSFKNVKAKWYPEVFHYCPEAAIIVVGTGIEKRNDPEVLAELSARGQAPVSYDEGKDLADKIKADKYMEVSIPNVGQVNKLFSDSVAYTLVRQDYIKLEGKK